MTMIFVYFRFIMVILVLVLIMGLSESVTNPMMVTVRTKTVKDGLFSKFVLPKSIVSDFGSKIVKQLKKNKKMVETLKTKNEEELDVTADTKTRPYRGGFLEITKSSPKEGGVTCTLPFVESKSDAELLSSYVSNSSVIITQPLPLIDIYGTRYYQVPSMTPFPLEMTKIEKLTEMPIITFNDGKATLSKSEQDSVNYFCMKEDVLDDAESEVSDTLEGIGQDYDYMRKIAEDISHRLNALTLSEVQVVSALNEMGDEVFDFNLLINLKKHEEIMNGMKLGEMRDYNEIMDIKDEVSAFVREIQWYMLMLERTNIIPFSICNVVAMNGKSFICVGKVKRSLSGEELFVHNNIFRLTNGGYGELRYVKYMLLHEGKECYVEDNSSLRRYLPVECCESLKNLEDYPTECPYTELNNHPTLYQANDQLVSLGGGDFEISCLDGIQRVKESLELLTDCSVKLDNTVKYGVGNYLAEAPETVEYVPILDWKDHALIGAMVTMVIVAMVLVQVIAKYCCGCSWCCCFVCCVRNCKKETNNEAKKHEEAKHEHHDVQNINLTCESHNVNYPLVQNYAMRHPSAPMPTFIKGSIPTASVD